jgi:lipopolysaccharide/colanic/teichoic acid biosynthesis glycosyltransferase
MVRQPEPIRQRQSQEERLIESATPVAAEESLLLDPSVETPRGISPVKRTLDLAIVVLGAPVWTVVLVLTASAIAVTSGFPVLYVSSRRVARNRSARVYKLRVMVKHADRIVNRDTVPIDGERFLNIPSTSPVYTKVGRWIERCSLTELPQLFNVLRGEMSIIGNRPLPENVVAALKSTFPNVEERFGTPAGLAGPVQLVGRDQLDDNSRLELELAYCELCHRAYSPWFDLRVLANTVLICLRLRRRFTVEEVKALILRSGGRRHSQNGMATPTAAAERRDGVDR